MTFVDGAKPSFRVSDGRMVKGAIDLEVRFEGAAVDAMDELAAEAQELGMGY